MTGGVWIDYSIPGKSFPNCLQGLSFPGRFALANELIEAKGIPLTRPPARWRHYRQSGDAAGWINHDGGVLGGITGPTLTAALPIPRFITWERRTAIVDLRNRPDGCVPALARMIWPALP